MTEEYVLRIIGSNDETPETKPAGGGIGVGAGLKIGAGIEMMRGLISMVSDTIGNVLRPIKTIAQGILKMVGELLRPIVDLLMLLFRPILIMIRPFIQMFKVFMDPFIQLARQFGNISAKRMASGDLAGSMQASMEGVKTLIYPFIISFTSVFLQLATTSITATLQMLGDMILDAIGWMIPPLKGKMEELKGEWDSGMINLTNDINKGIVSVTQDILGGMLKNANEKLTEYKTKWPEITDNYSTGLNTMVNSTTKFVDEMKAQAARLTPGISTKTSSSKATPTQQYTAPIGPRLEDGSFYSKSSNSYGSSAPTATKNAFLSYIGR